MGFFSSKSIDDYVDKLPTTGITVSAMKALDFVMPGEWENFTNFDHLTRTVTGESDEEFLTLVKDRAIELYNDKSEGYQAAMNLYWLTDKSDVVLGGSAFMDRISKRFSILSFLDKFTIDADKAQAIDLTLKLTVELIAFTKINGIPGDSFSDFVKALVEYGSESKMRMAGLVCYDGLVPLGPDFIRLGMDALGKLTPDQLGQNNTFRKINDYIPGGDNASKLGFIQKGFDSTKDWMGSFVGTHNLTSGKVVESLRKFVDVSDEYLDYLGGFIDMTTNYYEHTGTQTLAARLVERAVNEV